MGTRINTLAKLLVYTPIKSKMNGEFDTKWKYKTTIYLNMQQDINELDRNSAGDIDYDIYKGRTRKELDLLKGDGIYIVKVIKGKEEKIKNVDEKNPEYTVEKNPRIGRTTTYTFKKIV